MSANESAHTTVLSIIIAVLAVIAAGGGFFFPHIYRDAAVYGNDLVTLVVAVPLLGLALILARRGSLRARLVWLGLVHYTLYN